jgi:DNA adenine methylase
MVLDRKQRCKPIIKWAGGKSSLLSQFKAHFPETCKRYIEPFLGGGAVFLAIKEDFPAIINDSNGELYNLYSVIKNQPNDLIGELRILESCYSEDFYYKLRETLPTENIPRAARTIFLNKCGFNGLYRQNLKGQFNVPFGKRENCPPLFEEANLLAVSEKLQKAILCNQDFEEIISKGEAGDFIYCDPPYHPISQSSSFNNYQAGGFSAKEQERLAIACFKAKEKGCIVAISNSSCEFIKSLYKDAKIFTVKAKRAINSAGSKRGAIEELLVII